MQVTLVAGSYPPDRDGVADYTQRLEENLCATGINVNVFLSPTWRLCDAIPIARKLLNCQSQVFHLQYPCVGFGDHLGPHFLSLLIPLVVTLHECSQLHIVRRLSLYLFAFRASKIIFTSEHERRYAERWAPWIKAKTVVIPIGSNIPVRPPQPKSTAKIVTYFGLIRPKKGLEKVIDLARLLYETKSDFGVRIMGSIEDRYQNFYQTLLNSAAELPIQWVLNSTKEVVSHVLAESYVGYLPFPDGASERRSSLIAMLQNGMLVLTTLGPETPTWMGKAVLFANTPDDAGRLLGQICDNSMVFGAPQSRLYGTRFAWNHIVKQHVALYAQMVAK